VAAKNPTAGKIATKLMLPNDSPLKLEAEHPGEEVLMWMWLHPTCEGAKGGPHGCPAAPQKRFRKIYHHHSIRAFMVQKVGTCVWVPQCPLQFYDMKSCNGSKLKQNLFGQVWKPPWSHAGFSAAFPLQIPFPSFPSHVPSSLKKNLQPPLFLPLAFSHLKNPLKIIKVSICTWLSTNKLGSILAAPRRNSDSSELTTSSAGSEAPKRPPHKEEAEPSRAELCKGGEDPYPVRSRMRREESLGNWKVQWSRRFSGSFKGF
jgi:hypothetical protein